MSKIFIITGTRKGIGRELAEYYLSKGNIVAGCSRGDASIKHTNYLHFMMDVSDESMVLNMVRMVKKKFGRIDVLINNAGIASMNHIVTTSLETVSKIFSTNYYGAFLFSREVAKAMIRAGKGRIVNFSTVAVPLHIDGECVYASSKSAIETMTQIMAKEFADFGITVNAIGPTPIETDLINTVPKKKIEHLISLQAIKRFGTCDDVKNILDFYIDDRSTFVTGQILYLGGINGK